MSTRSPIASSATSSSSPLTTLSSPGSASITSPQLVPSSRPSSISAACSQSVPASCGSNSAPLLRSRDFSCRRHSMPLVVDLDDIGEAHDPGRERDALALDSVRDAPAVPALVRLPQRVAHRGREPDAGRELSLKRGMRGEPVVHLRPATKGERRDPARTSQAGLTRTQPPQHDQVPPERLRISGIGAGLHADVVAEPHRLLVRVGMAVDTVQQARVVGRDPVVLDRRRRDPQGEARASLAGWSAPSAARAPDRWRTRASPQARPAGSRSRLPQPPAPRGQPIRAAAAGDQATAVADFASSSQLRRGWPKGRCMTARTSVASTGSEYERRVVGFSDRALAPHP